MYWFNSEPHIYFARGVNADVMESWTVNQEIWGEGFLSWNRDQNQDLGDFAKQLQAKSKEKGINLIIDRDFDPKFYDRNPDRFSCLFPASFVLLSEDYVRSEKCMRELLDMKRFNMEPIHSIHYYTKTEIDENADAHDMLIMFRDIAYQTVKNEVEHPIIENTFIQYFYDHLFKCKPIPAVLTAAAADLALSKMMRAVIFGEHCFPNYDTFPALDACAKTGYDIITNNTLTPADDIMYLGIKGNNPKYNTFVARNICLPSRLESFVVKHTDLTDLIPVHFNREAYNLFTWGLRLAENIMHIYVKTIELNYHKSIIDNLPRQKCLLFIDNIPDYNSLKALALVFDFLSPGSRIFFTTTNEDFFTGYDNSWVKDLHKDSCNADLPTFSVTSRILDTDELKDAMKVLGYETETSTDVKHKLTHEESGPAEKKLKTIDNEAILSLISNLHD